MSAKARLLPDGPYAMVRCTCGHEHCVPLEHENSASGQFVRLAPRLDLVWPHRCEQTEEK